VETASNGVQSLAEVEVVAKTEWRRFTAEYNLKVLREADHCRESGKIGALLRREGLYWWNLTHWRKQRERGPQRRAKNSLAERDNARLKRRAKRAEELVELQRKSLGDFWGSN